MSGPSTGANPWWGKGFSFLPVSLCFASVQGFQLVSVPDLLHPHVIVSVGANLLFFALIEC